MGTRTRRNDAEYQMSFIMRRSLKDTVENDKMLLTALVRSPQNKISNLETRVILILITITTWNEDFVTTTFFFF